MGKFSFSKKSDKSSNPSANPYAQPSAPASAADPYAQAKYDTGVGGYNKGPNPPAVTGLPAGPKGGYGNGSSPFNPDSKSAGNASQYSGGYGSDRYGTQNGYGVDRYGGPSEPEPRVSRYGPGGYGGLGSTTDNITTESDTRPPSISPGNGQKPYGHDPPPYGANNGGSSYGLSSTSGAYSASSGAGVYDDNSRAVGYGGGSSYEAYGDRNLTGESFSEHLLPPCYFYPLRLVSNYYA